MDVAKALKPQQHNCVGPEIIVTSSSVAGRDACTSVYMYDVHLCHTQLHLYKNNEDKNKEQVETSRG